MPANILTKKSHAKTMARIRKKVRWNGIVFESRRDLIKHVGASQTTNINHYIKNKLPLKGHIPESVKE